MGTSKSTVGLINIATKTPVPAPVLKFPWNYFFTSLVSTGMIFKSEEVEKQFIYSVTSSSSYLLFCTIVTPKERLWRKLAVFTRVGQALVGTACTMAMGLGKRGKCHKANFQQLGKYFCTPIIKYFILHCIRHKDALA